MRITLTSTDELTTLDGVPGRVWCGRTDSGIEVVALIHRIAAHKDADLSQFDRELAEQEPPSAMAVEAFGLRHIL